MLLVIGVVHSGQSGPIGQVARMLGAAADVFEGGSEAALRGLEVTSNLSSELAIWSKDMLSTGRDMYVTLLHGVDFVNVTITKRRARIVTAGPAVMVSWLRADAASSVLDLPADAVAHLITVARSLSEDIPVIELEKTIFEPRYQFACLKVSGGFLASGHTEFVWEFIAAEFDLLWSNPVWEVLGFMPESEPRLIASVVRRVVEEAPTDVFPNSSLVPTALPLTTVVWAQTRRLWRGMNYWLLGAPPGLG